MLFNLLVRLKSTLLLKVFTIDGCWALVVQIKNIVIFNFISTQVALNLDNAVLLFQTACEAI